MRRGDAKAVGLVAIHVVLLLGEERARGAGGPRAGGSIDAMRCVMIADHDIPERTPIVVEPGDVVRVGDRDTEWPAFVFVTTPRGAGWVPARHIEIDGTVGVARVRYDTTELPARAGDDVDVIEDDPESGWSWCRDAEGREGWIPHRALAVA